MYAAAVTDAYVAEVHLRFMKIALPYLRVQLIHAIS